MWQVSFIYKREKAEIIESIFDDYAASYSFFETSSPFMWQFSAYFISQPEKETLYSLLTPFIQANIILSETIQVMPAVMDDWIAKMHQTFPPLSFGRYFIYGSHYKKPIPSWCLQLKIDAATAFGTGEHATTKGCLKAFDYLLKKRVFSAILDMGTGTGILAIAAAKILRQPVIAVDNDPEAVRVGRLNARSNNSHSLVTFFKSEGFKSNYIRKKASYDLIFANILARPLHQMALNMAMHIRKNGYAILSGLLKNQIGMIIQKYKAVGFIIEKKFFIGEWAILIVKK